MPPLGCFPLWGREGIILQAAAENKRIKTKGFQQNLMHNKNQQSGKSGSPPQPFSYLQIMGVNPALVLCIQEKCPKFKKRGRSWWLQYIKKEENLIGFNSVPIQLPYIQEKGKK